MVRIFLIIALQFFIVFKSYGQTLCLDTFPRDPLKNTLSFLQPRVPLQKWEVPLAGKLVTKKNSQAVLEQTLKRDGVYPLFVTANRQVMMSHRLPSYDVSTESGYLATHRSLYNRYLKLKKRKPEIIYSGQIRVIAGRIVSLVDQSNTFHQTLADLGRGATDQHLIDNNNARIDFALSVLRPWGFVQANTNVVNFWHRYHRYDARDRQDGHQSDRSVALFELQCRHSIACWQDYVQIKELIDLVFTSGETDFYKRLPMQIKNKDITGPISLLSEMAKEGVFDVMSRPWVRDNRHYQHLLKITPQLKAHLQN